MRAVLLEVPEAMLAERRQLGLDGATRCGIGSLGAQFATVEGRLRITWEGGVADV
ncbi:MAG: hypothetical protein ACRDRR_13995 [Pseudonocardiaceae bacterium]